MKTFSILFSTLFMLLAIVCLVAVIMGYHYHWVTSIICILMALLLWKEQKQYDK